MLDITTFAASREFIGGIAVVVSLIYLVLQIRVNTKTVRAPNFGDLLAANNEALAMTSDAENASLWVQDSATTRDSARRIACGSPP